MIYLEYNLISPFSYRLWLHFFGVPQEGNPDRFFFLKDKRLEGNKETGRNSRNSGLKPLRLRDKQEPGNRLIKNIDQETFTEVLFADSKTLKDSVYLKTLYVNVSIRQKHLEKESRRLSEKDDLHPRSRRILQEMTARTGQESELGKIYL